MGSVCGIFCAKGLDSNAHRRLMKMNMSMKHRGPDGQGSFEDDVCGLASNRLAVRDVERGAQPMSGVWHGHTYFLVFNGEIYDSGKLRQKLEKEGVVFSTSSDTEVLLYAYAVWGQGCLERLEGMFAFAVYDKQMQTLFCARDRQGIKPFYYNMTCDTFTFASEQKAFFESGCVKPRINREGLFELLYLAPVTLPHSAVFCDIKQLGAGEYIKLSRSGMESGTYWELKAAPHYETRDETVACTAALTEAAVRRCCESDADICTLLSGGLDSSVVSVVANEEERARGRHLSSYSLLYEDNEYEPTLFQPNRDDEYSLRMAEYLDAHHTVYTASNTEIAEALSDAVRARDLPGQADIDSSMLWLCGRVGERHRVTLTGEGGDEVFGGYPWYYRPEMLMRSTFPWLHNPTARAGLFKYDVTEGMVWLGEQYRAAVDACPSLEEDAPGTRTARVATALTMRYFMASLLVRMDRMSMYHAVEARVPFADTALVEYVFNVPWEMKFEYGTEKSLLRNAMAQRLPEDIAKRKKSPFPKTHSAEYENRVYSMLSDRLLMPDSRLREMLLPDALERLCTGSDITWFGQLMGRAQLFAWLYQFDLWLQMYDVALDL